MRFQKDAKLLKSMRKLKIMITRAPKSENQ